jgi:carbamate kinase
MRIDSSLSNSQYQSRYIQGITRAEDVAAEPVAVSRSRATGGSTTGTLLSASLANALWSLDSSKKASAVKTNTQVSSAADDASVASPTQRVEARYLEYMDHDEE